jgi:hypothetical protein
MTEGIQNPIRKINPASNSSHFKSSFKKEVKARRTIPR